MSQLNYERRPLQRMNVTKRRFSIFRDRDAEILQKIKYMLKLDRKSRTLEQKEMLVQYF